MSQQNWKKIYKTWALFSMIILGKSKPAAQEKKFRFGDGNAPN